MALEDKIRERVRKAIQERVFPGCVIGILHPRESIVLAEGSEAYDGKVVYTDSVYDVASITKSIPTALIALQLIEEHKLSLDDALIAYVPEYYGSYRDEIRIQHLLAYTVDGLRLSQFADASPEHIHDAVMHAKLVRSPGSAFYYSNMSAYLLGLVIESIAGNLKDAAQSRIFDRLQMRATTFFPNEAVPTEDDLRGLVHDESARVFARVGKVVGHAGLFSTVPDVLKVCESLITDEKILSRSTIALMTQNQLAPLALWGGLGWELNQPHWMGMHASAHTFGKTGFTGTSMVCDVARHIAIVILSNRVYPKRPLSANEINRFRADVCDIVFSS